MITYIDILLSAIFVAFGILISFTEKLKLERDILIAAVRAFVQLFAIGYVLKFIFAQHLILWTFGMILLMSLIGAWTSSRRAKGVPKPLSITVLAMLGTVTFSLLILWAFRIIPPKPMYFIPVAGMVIGNSMNTLSVGLIRFRDGIYDGRERIEAALALGKSPAFSVGPIIKKSLKISIIPRIDSVKVSGIIHLPGAMTGMILAGASPVQAVKFQVVIMYILLGTPVIAAYLATKMAYKRFFNPARQLIIPQLNKVKKSSFNNKK
ncbi:iron export ABC transporter permease subunit FetB [bacterium]|nr:iron export ABC transporter permease subunit FetB [bacterium]